MHTNTRIFIQAFGDQVCGVLDMGMVDMGREVEEGEGGGRKRERQSESNREKERTRSSLLTPHLSLLK